jgi:hypothetical protein
LGAICGAAAPQIAPKKNFSPSLPGFRFCQAKS